MSQQPSGDNNVMFKWEEQQQQKKGLGPRLQKYFTKGQSLHRDAQVQKHLHDDLK